jgi:CBS domain-containing protein
MREFLEYRVGDYMTVEPTQVSPGTTLAEAERIFEEHDFNGLPVVDSDGHLLGLVTKLDLLRAFVFTPTSIIPAYEDIMDSPVSAVMTAGPVSIPVDTRLTRVLHQMVETKIKSFPVVAGPGVVGIIAREDILRALHDAAQASEA